MFLLIFGMVMVLAQFSYVGSVQSRGERLEGAEGGLSLIVGSGGVRSQDIVLVTLWNRNLRDGYIRSALVRTSRGALTIHGVFLEFSQQGYSQPPAVGGEPSPFTLANGSRVKFEPLSRRIPPKTEVLLMVRGNLRKGHRFGQIESVTLSVVFSGETRSEKFPFPVVFCDGTMADSSCAKSAHKLPSENTVIR